MTPNKKILILVVVILIGLLLFGLLYRYKGKTKLNIYSSLESFNDTVNTYTTEILKLPVALENGGCFTSSFDPVSYSTSVNNLWTQVNTAITNNSFTATTLPTELQKKYDESLALYTSFTALINLQVDIDGKNYNAPFGNLMCSDYCGNSGPGATSGTVFNIDTCSCSDPFSYPVNNSVSANGKTVYYIKCKPSDIKKALDSFITEYNRIPATAILPKFSGVCGSTLGVTC